MSNGPIKEAQWNASPYGQLDQIFEPQYQAEGGVSSYFGQLDMAKLPQDAQITVDPANGNFAWVTYDGGQRGIKVGQPDGGWPGSTLGGPEKPWG